MKKIYLLCVVIAMLLNNVWGNGQNDNLGIECQRPKSVSVIVKQSKGAPEIISENNELNSQIENSDIDIDYGLLMANAIANGDYGLAMLCEDVKNQQNERIGIKGNLSYDDLFLLSKIIEAEAGSSWLTEEHRLLVASVVINRVNSPEYPNTIYDVIYQEGQYAPAGKKSFDELIPSRDSVMAAYKILTEGSIAPPDVVYQANFRQGSGIYHTIYDSKLGTTYFCYSSKRNIYE